MSLVLELTYIFLGLLDLSIESFDLVHHSILNIDSFISELNLSLLNIVDDCTNELVSIVDWFDALVLSIQLWILIKKHKPLNHVVVLSHKSFVLLNSDFLESLFMIDQLS